MNGTYVQIMQQNFSKDFAEDDEFTTALLDSCENTKEEDKCVTYQW